MTWTLPYLLGSGDLTAAAPERLITFSRGERVSAFVQRSGLEFDRVATVLREAVDALDLEAAVPNSAALDIIGGLLQRPRDGLADLLYQRVLRIQVELILSSVGTVETYIRLVRIFTGFEAVSYQELPPTAIALTAIVPDAEAALLGQLLAEARPASYQITLATASTASGYLICDSTTNPVAGAGILDSTTDPQPGATPMAGVQYL